MNYLDLFLAVLFIIGAVKGYMKGLIVELFSFLAFFIGLFIAIELTIPLSVRFFQDSGHFQVLTIGVFIGLFLVSVFLINLAAKTIKKAVDLTFMGFFDNILGAIASLFKWAFIISVILWVFDSIGVKLPSDQAESSILFPIVKNIGPQTFIWLSEVLPFLKDVIDSLKDIKEKDGTVYTFL